MKKLLILVLGVFLVTACGENTNKSEEPARYTQNSDEINTFKTVIAEYEKGNWDAYKSHYADTSKIYHNSTQAMNKDQLVSSHQESLGSMASYGFVTEENEYERVITDDNHTWVNFWGRWEASPGQGQNKIVIPVHVTARFEDGKIVEEHGYWDNGIVMAAMEQMEAQARQDSIDNASN